MKLRDNYITQDIDGTQVMVATGESSFNGIVRANQTAAAIVDLLKKETTKEKIVEEMLKIYDAGRDVIERDVDKVVSTLRSIGALEE